jgi:outer membrane protein assembly factor BamB
MASTTLTSAFRDTLRAALSVILEVWSYKAKDWVMSVHAADINNDGDLEVLGCSRDGRLRALSKTGILLWERVIGNNKAWASAIVGIPGELGSRERVIAGTRDGKVYAYAHNGRTVGRDGTLYKYNSEGYALDSQTEAALCLLDTGAVIRTFALGPDIASSVIVGSQDSYAYALNYKTGELLWPPFHADGWVRAVSCGDIDGDSRAEVIVGSNEKTLYILSAEGICLTQEDMRYPVHAVYAVDVDHDGAVEILVATDGKDLAAFTPQWRDGTLKLDKKWQHRFDNRLHSIYVADIDHDGHNEIILGSEDQHFYILDDHGKTLWRHYLGYRVFSVYAADIDNDGKVEIIIGAEDGCIHVYRAVLDRELKNRVRHFYASVIGVPSSSALTSLPADESRLLRDLLEEERKQREAYRHVNIEAAEKLYDKGEYMQSLAVLAKLEQRRVQVLWRKERRDNQGMIRSLCFGHMSNGKRNIVVGTNEGDIRIYNTGGRRIRTISIGERVLDVQTGYIERGREDIVVLCASNHTVYLVSNKKTREYPLLPLEYETTCMYISSVGKQGLSEVLLGSEKGINHYGDGLHAPANPIDLPEGIRQVHAHTRTGDERPEIIAGSTNRTVYAYTRKREYLWEYEVWDRVQAIAMYDIDSNGEVEVIVGSEDRNVHVFNRWGQLLWRYLLPHSVLAVQALDVDQDGKAEILAGCADGYLYVLSREGDLLWKYQANDRIRSFKAEDIDGDGNIEIVIGAEDELEVLQVVNRGQVCDLRDQCFSALQGERSPAEAYLTLLDSPDPALRAFALASLAEQPALPADVFDIFEKRAGDSYVEVRIALVRAVVSCYTLDPERASTLLDKLSVDTDQEVKLAVVECMPILARKDWERGFAYLERLFAGGDRLIRRTVVRQLQLLIDIPHDHDGNRNMFMRLLKAAQEQESEWIRQEAARALAHFLDSHYERLIIYIHLFIVNQLKPEIAERVGRYAFQQLVQKFVFTVVPFLGEIRDDQALHCLGAVVDALKEMTMLEYGKDALKLYTELYRLFALNAIDEIALYRCPLTEKDFGPGNKLAVIALGVIARLNSVTRYLAIYMRREGIYDRLSSLLEAQRAISDVQDFVEQAYSGSLMGFPTRGLPDHVLLGLLLRRWQRMVFSLLNELRGKAELKAELRTRTVLKEEQVVILFQVRNVGSGSAENVKATLLYSDDFDVVGNITVESETLFSHDTLPVEFTIRPRADNLELKLEVFYEDVEYTEKPEDRLKHFEYIDRLELQSIASRYKFRYIPNPYSTGTPIHDNEMFYGREEDLEALQNNLARTAAQTVMLLYGQRRTGKTTLLLHLANTSVLGEHVPVLIDMQHESYNIDITKFLHNMAYYIAQAMNAKGYSMSFPEMEIFDKGAPFAFGIFLDKAEKLLRGQKLIILIDEFEVLEEQIEKGRLKPEILDYFRSIMQAHRNVNFLLAGTHRIDELATKNWSVFFNVALKHRLSRLSARGAESLISWPVEQYIEFAPFTVDKIRQLTADQPYLIHLICRALVDHCNDQRRTYATLNDISAVLHEAMLTCASHFEWLWQQFSIEVKYALAVIAELGRDEGRWLPYTEIEEAYRDHHLSFKRERLQASIKFLAEADIVDIEGNGVSERVFMNVRVRIPIGLLRMWMLKEKPLRMISGELPETITESGDDLRDSADR